ncbi:MAG: hypothetical protein IT503_15210 [Burkholderiaceae bacterium]|nr:MAG: hypothetical protein F9K36_18280 [Burkholderiaceae bacterium]MBE7427447.1 hypothetical protein [Ideonella sp.]MCC7287522.1 hypothetical protein [Burkholderiaceae bacterium]
MEKSFAAVVLLMCLAVLVRMMLPRAARSRVDRSLQRAWWWTRDAFVRLRRRSRVSRADAQRQARDAIERAARRKNKLH